ncbi:hypothetical protein AGR2A_Cc160190 [Agrobacterium genomosp. 2 str. CFBP 5494]|uniref:Uncharacterized protein n=1 Tax=Agrobacterium genomosp. 2 str. CFBP 5494 TaxID=1183436 RepID=A0A9W5EZR5_9HYPH|nr:hypothetical protein AGR2A_Cc160190 [Agrobacterium genomosp. 2 str. CFBP 5494]
MANHHHARRHPRACPEDPTTSRIKHTSQKLGTRRSMTEVKSYAFLTSWPERSGHFFVHPHNSRFPPFTRSARA